MRVCQLSLMEVKEGISEPNSQLTDRCILPIIGNLI
jgi:hypothetical protein